MQQNLPRGPRWIGFALALLLVSWLAGVALPLSRGQSPVDLGLDLAGGVRVTYRPDFASAGSEWADADRGEILARAKETLASRLARGSTAVPDVVVRSDERIVVSLPGTEDRAEALDRIGRTYRLTFRLLEGELPEGSPAAFRYGGRLLELGPARFTGEMLEGRSISASSAEDGFLASPIVTFRFAAPHDREFAAFTEEHLGRELAILIDEDVFWVGRIESRIDGPGSLRGSASLEDARELATMLRSGSLPVPLEVESLTVVGSALGHDVATEGFRALRLSLLALVLLLCVAYVGRGDLLVAGLLSTLSLVILLSGLTTAFRLTLDLAGIAGLVLSVGMGMDAFLIVLERLAERAREKRSGRLGPVLAALFSFRGEGRTLFHANATTVLVVALLSRSERLASFALFLIVGLLASVLNIFVTRRLLGWSGRRIPNLGPDLFAGARSARPGVLRARWIYALLLALVVGVVAFRGVVVGGTVGPGLGPEFRPGTQMIVAGPAEALEAGLDALRADRPAATVRHSSLGDLSEERWLVAVDEAGGAAAGEGAAGRGLALDRLFADHGLRLESLDTVDSMVSSGRLKDSLRVLWVSFVLLALYFVAIEEPVDRWFGAGGSAPISKRSRLLVFAGVLLAVGIDLVLVLVALSVLELPISLPVVAALLAIVGYSVNDSVVLWSRVRQSWDRRCAEITGSERRTPRQVVARAVDEITSRAVLTTVSTAIPAWAILTVGPAALRDFAWVIVVGTLSGTLSSLFVVATAAELALRREVRADRQPTVASSPASEGTVRRPSSDDPGPGSSRGEGRVGADLRGRAGSGSQRRGRGRWRRALR